MTEYGIKALKTKVKHGDVLSTEEKNFIGKILEKQIPKQVKGKSVTHEGYVANCPFCNKFIRFTENKIYCECGQTLKW